MTNDLVKRLRAPHNWFSESDEGHRGPNNAPEEAADRIEELEAENARLRDLADPLFDAAQHVHRDGGRVTRGEER